VENLATPHDTIVRRSGAGCFIIRFKRDIYFELLLCSSLEALERLLRVLNSDFPKR